MHKPKKETEELLVRSINYAVILDKNNKLISSVGHPDFVEVGASKRQVRVLFTETEIDERLPFKGLIIRLNEKFEPMANSINIFATVQEIYASVHNA